MFCVTVFPNNLDPTHLGPDGSEFTTSICRECPNYQAMCFSPTSLMELGDCIKCHKEEYTKMNLILYLACKQPSSKGVRGSGDTRKSKSAKSC